MLINIGCSLDGILPGKGDDEVHVAGGITSVPDGNGGDEGEDDENESDEEDDG